MALPKIQYPTYETVLPISKKKVTYRTFLTKEEKILLMASESNDENEMVRAMKQIVNNCTVTPIDVEKLPLIDLEYFFVKLRAKSIQEVIEARYECRNLVSEGKQCGNIVKVLVDLEKIEVRMPEKDLSVITVTPTVAIKMRYPTFELLQEITKLQDANIDDSFKIIAQCIESVSDGDEVNTGFTIEEAVEFLENLPQESFLRIREFLNSLPEIWVKFQFKCSKCGYEEEIAVEGISEISDFFD